MACVAHSATATTHAWGNAACSPLFTPARPNHPALSTVSATSRHIPSMATNRLPASHAPDVAGVANGTATRANSSASGSNPNRARAWKIADFDARARPARARNPSAVLAAAVEAARRGAQHQPVDERAVALPQQHGDRSAHRVADRDEALDAEHVGQGGHVVGAVLEPERARGSGCPGRGPGGRGRRRGSAAPSGGVGAEPVEVGGRPSSRGAARRRAHRAGRPARARTWCPGRAARPRGPAAAAGAGPSVGHGRAAYEAASRRGSSRRACPWAPCSRTMSPARWPDEGRAERRAGRDDVELVVALLDVADQVASRRRSSSPS